MEWRDNCSEVGSQEGMGSMEQGKKEGFTITSVPFEMPCLLGDKSGGALAQLLLCSQYTSALMEQMVQP